MLPNKLKLALAEGRTQIGTVVGQFRSPEVVRVLAASGFHWAFIDTEHGGFDLETVQDMCRVALLSGITPVVRVADPQYPLIARALDCGAQGIILPRIDDPELLAKAVRWTKFPPDGDRGFGLTVMQANYAAATIPQMIEHFNAHTLVVAQIESVEALERREELLAVPGLDAALVGPADMSVSLGVPGEFDHPKVVAAIEAVRDSCVARGIVPGLQIRSAALAKQWRDRGIRLLGCGSEFQMLFERSKEVAAQLGGG